MVKKILVVYLILFLIIIKQTNAFALQNITPILRGKIASGLRSFSCYCDDLNKLCKFSDTIDLRITNEECPENCPTGQAKYYDINFGITNEICGYRKLISTTYPEGIANIGEYPWHVTILKLVKNKLERIGAGVLITSNHVLTVAHKVKSIAKSSIVVHIGDTTDYGDDICTKHEYKVQFLIIHPKFDDKIHNNIAVLKLASSVPLATNPHINIACLPLEAPKAKKRCWISVFSKEPYYHNGSLINPLREIDVPIVDGTQCEARLRTTRLSYNFQLDKKSLICAGGELGKDSCAGDGGAPLICERSNGQWEVVGLILGGVGCGQTIPALYVNIENYVAWIHEQITNLF